MDETLHKDGQRLAQLLIERSLEDSDEKPAPASPVIDAEFKDIDRVNGPDYWDEDAGQSGQDDAA